VHLELGEDLIGDLLLDLEGVVPRVRIFSERSAADPYRRAGDGYGVNLNDGRCSPVEADKNRPVPGIDKVMAT
jgi:hypothetical protein